MIKSCKISADGIFLNGVRQTIDFDVSEDWKKQLYKSLNLEYSKFHKMDDLSKMSLLSVALLNESCNFKKFNDEEISLIFSNKNSSSFTDLKFKSSYSDQGNPSPSLFVYTLPNITIGEISIFMKWFGENIFLISKDFNSVPFEHLLSIEFHKGASACLCGWVDKTEKIDECFMFFVEENAEIYNKKMILDLFNQ